MIIVISLILIYGNYKCTKWTENVSFLYHQPEGLGDCISVTLLNKIANERRDSNNEAPSCNHYCSGKAISITYYECVSVALGIQHVTHMRRDSTCGLSGSTTFFHILHKRYNFREKVI